MVAIQLPNWWQALVLYQAVARLGAIVAPAMTTIRPRELERTLRRVGAHVCITVDRWAEFDHADALRDIASRLPNLRHRVVIGPAGDGDIEFASMFEETAWEQRHSVALDDVRDDPDAVSMVIFTSGTTGEPKAALHTHNTVYSSFAGLCEALEFDRSDVVFCPHALMHLAGHLLAHTALTTGASTVLLDSRSGARGLQVMVESRTSRMMAAPVFIYDLLTAIGMCSGPLSVDGACCHAPTTRKSGPELVAVRLSRRSRIQRACWWQYPRRSPRKAVLLPADITTLSGGSSALG